MVWVRNEAMLGWRMQDDDSIKQFVRAHDGCGRTNQRECDKGMKAKKRLCLCWLFIICLSGLLCVESHRLIRHLTFSA